MQSYKYPQTFITILQRPFFKLQITFKNSDNNDMWTPYISIIDAMHNENNLCDSKNSIIFTCPGHNIVYKILDIHAQNI